MPSIVDMGMAGVLNQQQSNILNDPGLLLSALSMRDQQRQRRIDNENTDRAFNEDVRRFDIQAGQAGQRLDLARNADTRAQRGFDIGMAQDEAAGGYFTQIGDQMGLFEHEDPMTGKRVGVPEIRQRFEQMGPEDQKRAIAMHMEDMAAQAQQQQARKAEIQAKSLLGGFQKQLMGAAQVGDVAEQDAQMFAERMQGAITGASGEKPYQVMEDFQALRQSAMKERVETERRLGIAAGVQPMLQATANNPQLHGQAAMLLDGYTTGGITDDQFFDGIGQIQKVQAAAQKATAGDLTGLLTSVYGFTPEDAAQINQAIGSGVMDFSRLPQVPRPGEITDAQKLLLDELQNQTRAAEKKAETAGPDDPEAQAVRAARGRFGQEFQKATGQEFPAEQAQAPTYDDTQLDDALAQARKKLGKKATEDEILTEAERILSGGS